MSERMETYRAVVAPKQCDHLGHMNVQYYFAAVSDGMFAFQTGLGLGPSQLRERQLSFAVVQAESSFRRELVAGDVVRLTTWVEKVGTKSASFLHALERVEDGEVAFEARFNAVLLDLATRKATEIPPDIRTALEGHLAGSD